MSSADSVEGPSSLSQSKSSPPKPPSKRWLHFHSALQLAIQRAAHKWTYEEFSECFELWTKEDSNGALSVYGTISDHMEHLITSACDELFTKYDARENIDILHEVVTDARARQKAGEQPGSDTWRADLDPRTAARARTVPLLTEERDRLKAELAELEQENYERQEQIVANVNQMKAFEAEEKRRMDLLQDLEAKWSSLPVEDIQEWTLRTAETLATKATA